MARRLLDPVCTNVPVSAAILDKLEPLSEAVSCSEQIRLQR